jgi:hypothetical protein
LENESNGEEYQKPGYKSVVHWVVFCLLESKIVPFNRILNFGCNSDFIRPSNPTNSGEICTASF